MYQVKTVAGVTRANTIVTRVNSVTICTVVSTVMSVGRRLSGESADRLVYVLSFDRSEDSSCDDDIDAMGD
jgi:hypothetical protein